MDRIKELGLRSISEFDLERIMRSVSSGSPSSPGTGVSMTDSGDSGTSSLSGDALGGLGNTSTGTGTEDNLSLPSELLAELGGSPLPWRGDGRAGAVGGGGAAVGRVPYPSYPPDLCTEYQRRVDELQAALDRSIHERKLLELEMSKRLRQAGEAAAEAARGAALTLSAAQAQGSALEGECASLRERLEARKSEFHALLIPPTLYAELAAQPPHTLSLRQAVQVRVHELMAPLAGARAEVEEAVREASKARGEAAAAGLREAAASERAGCATRECEALRMRLEEAGERLLALASGSAALEALEGRASLAEEGLRREVEWGREARVSLEALQGERDGLVVRCGALEAQVVGLSSEREGLLREVESARGEARRAEDREVAARDALGTREAYVAQLQAVVSRGEGMAGQGSSSHLEAARAREERDRASASLLESLREGHEREVRELRESREAALAQALEAKALLTAAQVAKAGLESAGGAALRASTQQCMELECEVRRCSGEMVAALEAKEEAKVALGRARVEGDALRDKVGVLQASLGALEAASAARVAALQAALQVAKVKLGEREGEEGEYDSAVEAMGRAEAAVVEGTSTAALALAEARRGVEGGGEREGGVGGQGAGAAAAANAQHPLSLFPLTPTHPTSLQRRVAQAVRLAKELWLTKARVGELEGELEEEREARATAEGDARAFKGILEAVKGPGEYLVVAMEKCRGQVREARVEAVEAAKATRVASGVVHGLEVEVAGLKGQLQRVVEERDREREVVARITAGGGYHTQTLHSSSSPSSSPSSLRSSLPVGVSSPPLPSPHAQGSPPSASAAAAAAGSPFKAHPGKGVGGRHPFGGGGEEGEGEEGIFASDAREGVFEVRNVEEEGGGRRAPPMNWNHGQGLAGPWGGVGGDAVVPGHGGSAGIIRSVDTMWPEGGGRATPVLSSSSGYYHHPPPPPPGGSPGGGGGWPHHHGSSTTSTIQVRPLVRVAGSTKLPAWYSHTAHPSHAHTQQPNFY